MRAMVEKAARVAADGCQALISATLPGYILKNSTFSNAARRVSGVNVTGK